MRKKLAAAVMAACLAVALIAAPAGAGVIGDPCGCTPGFWKNNTDAWLNAWTPEAPVSTMFAAVPVGTDLDGDGAADTIMDALNYNGGGGVEGAERILLRAAVAAVLNRAAFGTSYQYEGPIRADVNAAIASGKRGTMLDLKDVLDELNNTLCELNAHGEHI